MSLASIISIRVQEELRSFIGEKVTPQTKEAMKSRILTIVKDLENQGAIARTAKLPDSSSFFTVVADGPEVSFAVSREKLWLACRGYSQEEFGHVAEIWGAFFSQGPRALHATKLEFTMFEVSRDTLVRGQTSHKKFWRQIRKDPKTPRSLISDVNRRIARGARDIRALELLIADLKEWSYVD